MGGDSARGSNQIIIAITVIVLQIITAGHVFGRDLRSPHVLCHRHHRRHLAIILPFACSLSGGRGVELEHEAHLAVERPDAFDHGEGVRPPQALAGWSRLLGEEGPVP